MLSIFLCFDLVPILQCTFLPFRFGALVDCLASTAVQDAGRKLGGPKRQWATAGFVGQTVDWTATSRVQCGLILLLFRKRSTLLYPKEFEAWAATEAGGWFVLRCERSEEEETYRRHCEMVEEGWFSDLNGQGNLGTDAQGSEEAGTVSDGHQRMSRRPSEL